MELGGLGLTLSRPPSPSRGPREWSPLRKFLGSKTSLDYLKIGLNSAKKNLAYIFESTPKKLIRKPPYKFLQPKGHGTGGRGGEGQLWNISNLIVKVSVNATC